MDERYRHEAEHFDAVARAGEGFDCAVNRALSPFLVGRHILPRLGDIRGRRVLECGCGSGALTAEMARRGARVVGFDLSRGMASLARGRVRGEGHLSEAQIALMSAEQMALRDASFDLVVGVAVLHHTDLARSRAEVWRVLRPGGHALFLEPLVGNPLIRLYRRLTPNWRTPDERPFTLADVRFFAEPFAGLRHEEHYLTGLATLFAVGVLRSGLLARLCTPATDAVDSALMRVLPFLREWCAFTVFEVFR